MVSRKQLPHPAKGISGSDRPMTAKVMKSLDEYEQLLAPVRECFAISPGVQAINSSSNDVFLESFLLHFCALGSQMTEPVERWIGRAAGRCAHYGARRTGECFERARSSRSRPSSVDDSGRNVAGRSLDANRRLPPIGVNH